MPTNPFPSRHHAKTKRRRGKADKNKLAQTKGTEDKCSKNKHFQAGKDNYFFSDASPRANPKPICILGLRRLYTCITHLDFLLMRMHVQTKKPFSLVRVRMQKNFFACACMHEIIYPLFSFLRVCVQEILFARVSVQKIACHFPNLNSVLGESMRAHTIL